MTLFPPVAYERPQWTSPLTAVDLLEEYALWLRQGTGAPGTRMVGGRRVGITDRTGGGGGG